MESKEKILYAYNHHGVSILRTLRFHTKILHFRNRLTNPVRLIIIQPVVIIILGPLYHFRPLFLYYVGVYWIVGTSNLKSLNQDLKY